ncbi:hypothetical protein RYX56_17145 [Alkalihalophilus lindianensis]|uniref:Uncharacterized protein n=1 Tax=Alkalihalophilus lindianensis TaxID=1630542 RepID=A0ABU3XDX6_9BACI|nr:hypothetical protein [Alkalihalophilus lindianensis]MDV2686097.1 hypothetical protein [Alkalihalophilus lindianensis]
MAEKKTRQRLTILSKELNNLLNKLHEQSKTHKPLTSALLLKNALIFLVRKAQTFLSLQGLFNVLLIIIPSYIIHETTTAFEQILALPLSSLSLLLGIGLVLLFLYIRTLVLNEMSRIGSDLFHIEVYEKRMKAEYNSLISLAQEKDFIELLKEEVFLELEQRVDNGSINELEECRALLKQLELDIGKKDDAIESLLVQLEETEESAELFKEKYDLLIEFIYQLKSKLNLLVTDQFNLDNIDFGTSYSLYQVDEDQLVFIDSYGINKAELDVFIPISEGKNKYVRSIDKTQKDPLILPDFISWKRILQDGSEWIISLHLDHSNRSKLNVEDETGKLNLTITQELLWICCELLNKFATYPKKKGEH